MPYTYIMHPVLVEPSIKYILNGQLSGLKEMSERKRI